MAEYLATVDAQRALQMTLVAEVATAYYELVALDQEPVSYTHLQARPRRLSGRYELCADAGAGELQGDPLQVHIGVLGCEDVCFKTVRIRFGRFFIVVKHKKNILFALNT